MGENRIPKKFFFSWISLNSCGSGNDLNYLASTNQITFCVVHMQTWCQIWSPLYVALFPLLLVRCSVFVYNAPSSHLGKPHCVVFHIFLSHGHVLVEFDNNMPVSLQCWKVNHGICIDNTFLSQVVLITNIHIDNSQHK